MAALGSREVAGLRGLGNSATSHLWSGGPGTLLGSLRLLPEVKLPTPLLPQGPGRGRRPVEPRDERSGKQRRGGW